MNIFKAGADEEKAETARLVSLILWETGNTCGNQTLSSVLLNVLSVYGDVDRRLSHRFFLLRVCEQKAGGVLFIDLERLLISVPKLSTLDQKIDFHW